MKVLPVTGMYCQPKTIKQKSTSMSGHQNFAHTVPCKPGFIKNALAEATFFCAILGGSALILVAPAAVIACTAAGIFWAASQWSKSANK